MFVGLVIGGFVVGGNTPDSDASAQHVVAFYHSNRHSQIASDFLLAYAVIFGLFFGAALRSYLRARSKSDGLIALGFAGMIVFAIGTTTLAALDYAAADNPTKITPAAEQALNVLANDVFLAFLIGLGVFLLGNGIAIVRTKALPRWLGWIAVVGSVVAVTPAGWFVLFGLLGWTLVVSVLMFIREGRPSPQTATTPTAGA